MNRRRRPPPRTTYIRRNVTAGCHVCKPDYQVMWDTPNAQGVAARHTDATGHRTWCEVLMNVTYQQTPTDQ